MDSVRVLPKGLLVALVVLVTPLVRATVHQNSSVSTPATLDAEIREISSGATGFLQRRIDDTLRRDSGGRILERVDPGDLGRMGSDTQSFLMKRLTRPEFAAMRDYVALQFPRSPTADHLDPALGIPAVSRPAALAYSEMVSAFVKRIGANPLAVTLEISSQPTGAMVDLRTAAVRGPESATNATLKNVYRGLYTFRVTKPTYKPAMGTLNLVDDDRPHLDCALALLSDLQSESSCRRR